MHALSLAQWSLHRSMEAGRVTHSDFPRIAREEFDIGTLELVNTLTDGHEPGRIRQFNSHAKNHGVDVLLIMIDDEGDLCALTATERKQNAENHFKWLDAATELGCRAVRINTGPEIEMSGDAVEADAVERCAESCHMILEYARERDLEVLLENHGGVSANIDLLTQLLDAIPDPLFGTLPDFGNFPLEDPSFNPYDFVARMMPRAKSVSAKCFDLERDNQGRWFDPRVDFVKMMDIVRTAGYEGFLGIEYEGESADEFKGIRNAKEMIEQILGS